MAARKKKATSGYYIRQSDIDSAAQRTDYGRRLPVYEDEDFSNAEDSTAAAPIPEQEYKRGFVEDTLLSDRPTTGLGLAVANLFANRQAANASTEVNAALAEQLTPKEDIELGKLQQQLADLRAGKAKKRSVFFGPGEAARPQFINEDYTPEEAKAVEAKLLSDIDALNKRVASGEFSAERETAGRNAAIAQAKLAAAQKVADETKAQLGSGTERISRNLGQASTLEQVLPTLGSLGGGAAGFAVAGAPGAVAGGGAGAALGAIPAAKAVYNQALVQAMLPPEQGGYGADYDDAVEYAAGNVAIEFGSEALGGVLGAGAVVAKKLASKFAGGLTKKALEQSLLATVRSRKARAIAATGAEYLSELASNAGQIGFDQLLSASHEFGTEAGRELMRENVRKEVANFGETSLDTLIQTVAIGGPAAVVGANAAYKADIAKRQAEIAPGAVQRGLANIVTREPARPTNELNLPPVREQQQQLATDMFPATDVGVDPAIAQREADLKAAEERVAWNQRNRERAAETNLENQRNGIVAQLDNATSRVENLRDRVENGDTSQATLNTLAAAQREQRNAQAELDRFDSQQPAAQPTQVAQEPQQLDLPLNEPKQPKKPAGGFVMSSETDRQNAELAKTAEATLKEQQKRDNKLIEDELKRQNADRNKRRKEALMAAADQSRNLTPDQRLKAIADAARTFDSANPAVTRDQLDIEQLLAQANAKNQKSQKGKPKWTPSTPAAPVAQAAQAQQAPAATSEIGKRIEQLAANLPKAMAMEEGGATTAAPAFNIKKFVKDTSEIIRSLVKDNSQKAIDILNMEQQGKLAFVPNPESVGLDMSDNTRAAYKVENGKMYIFTDRVNPKDAVGTIIRGYHEATHAGQFNKREGRGAVMSSLLGDAKFGDSVSRVLAAAKNGNTVAKSALRATEAQLGKDAVDTNPELFKKELMGHFVGEVVRARSKPLGSVAGVARDILAGARNAVRAVTGVELDVSFNDIYSAVNELGREVVATDVKGRDSNDVLAMIYNVREGKPSPGQKRAIDEGYVYDSVDGTKKYVLSDADATMSDYQYQQIVDTASGEPVPLGDVLDHEVLYRERPEADTEVSVKVVDTLGPGVFGQYDPESKTVLVAKSALKKGKDYVLGTIMHEVQHYVQHMDGRAQQFFENDASGKLKAAEKKVFSAARQNDLAANSMIDTAMRKYRGTDVGDSIQDIVNNLNLKEPIKARLVGEILAKQPKLDSKLKEFYDDYIATRAKHNAELDKYHEVSAEEYAKYRRNITEKEAFFTQGQRKTTQAGLDRMNIEDVMRNQERDAQGNDITEGQIDVPSERYGLSKRAGTGMPQQFVFHGTPHTVDRFSLQKIGTGEGTQAYGWGLYFASVREIADHYRKALSGDGYGVVRINGLPQVGDPEFGNLMVLEIGERPPTTLRGAEAYEYMRSVLQQLLNDEWTRDRARLAISYLNQSENAGLSIEVPGRDEQGNLYRVDIPEDSDLLDWDKPLSEQPEKVRKALLASGIMADLQALADKRNAKREELNRQSPGRLTHPVIGKLANKVTTVEDISGRDIYEAIAATGGGPRAATETLLAAGIPGLRYLDGNSRSKGEGSANYVIWDEAAISTPENVLKSADSTESVLAMEESTPIEITDRWLPAKIRGLFDATRGIGKIKNEIIEHAMDSPAGERMRAEASMGKYDRALIQQAAERGMTPTELNAEIEAAIQKLPQKLVGYDENIAAFNSVADKYGEAGEALKEMRDQIDALSLQMVEDRFASPIPLSAAEQKLYQTILNNLGKYNNRQYAAFAGAAGEKYSKAVWDDYLKRKKAGDVIDDVTEKNYQKVANAVNKLVKDTLYIPDAEGLGRMKAERARRLYNTWIGNPENVELSDIKQALYDRREQINANKPILEQRAETIVKQLLGLTKLNEPIAQYYRGAKTDMGILKKRKKISPELRELLGEITDPSMAMLMTTAKLAEFTARTKMMLELSANVGGDLLPPEAIAPDNWQPLDGEGFGPLQGYKASPNLHAALSDVAQMHATFEQAVAMAANQPAELGRKIVVGASDAWGKAAKIQKTWQIVANPANFILNFGGGSMLMLQNGNVNLVNMLRGLRDAADLVTYSMNPKVAKPSSIRLVENGVVDSAFIGEIKAEQFRELNTLIKQMSGRSDSEAMALAKKYFTKALAGGKEAYAMADVLYKIANFHHQVDHLTKFYEAEGKDVTPEQIDREAATDVKRTNFTYRRAAPLIKALEQRGFTMFGPYMSEVFRTQVTNILQGIGEIKRGNDATTPEGKRIMTMRGASRIAGQLVSYGLIYGAGKLLASATFGDDEKKESALRSLLPEYLRDQDFGLMGKDENGYPVVYQLSRLDPVGPATDLLRAAYNGDDVTVKDILAKVADTYVTPRLAGRTYELGKAIATDKAPSREPLAKQVAPEFYSDIIDIAKKFGLDRATVLALTNIGESFMPGFMNSWRDSNGRVVGDTPQDAVFRIASYSGFTFNSLDPSKPLTFAARDYSSATKDARTRLAEFFRDNPDRTDLEIQNELLRLQKDEYDAFTQLAKVRKGANILEYPAAEAAAIMKKARLNTTQMRAIANGDFKSSVVSRASIQRYRDQDLADAKPADRPEIRKRWKEIENRLMSANKNLQRGNE